MQTLIISLGGSLIVPDKVDANFLKKFKAIILNYIKRGNRVILICGGGSICRKYQKAAKAIKPSISNIDLDWLGIAATKYNAYLVKTIFGENAASEIINNPTEKTKANKKIIIGSGWKPGCSTDKDAVLAARTYKADMIINLSNIKYVYDKDPRKFKNAKPMSELSWKKLRKITGNKYSPGMNVPFDPLAAKLSEKLGLKLIIIKGNDLNNFKKFLRGEKFQGTIIN